MKKPNPTPLSNMDHWEDDLVKRYPDPEMAKEKKEFRNYVSSIKKSIKIIKNPVNKDDVKIFRNMKKVFEKKIILKKDKKKNEIIILKDLKFLKAKKGIYSKQVNQIIGKKLKKSLTKNSILLKKDLL